MMQVVIRLLT